ncbi:hypothetical protein N7539_004678 [Penicillium diatomitis]|uniref:Methyltransferase domain-containing protein n=1 Tax=Penicillium diatomitis TaxID=2819901 RepID=A0A9W9XFA0_9EURO|nr:uncharacterized protein N7539_004678 [Penicillium diatomitis]KAJ5489788.1 hypothetical protein N7539_004678 [Penicillium diatomitis]
MSESDHAPHTYILTRTKTEAQRIARSLDRQYDAWQANIKYLLHPAITIYDHARVADIGRYWNCIMDGQMTDCSNIASWIWLRDISRELPSSCQLQGFDISAARFPDRQTLFSNVTLFEHDMFKPFAEDFMGDYDVVHVRLMIVALSSNQWAMAVQDLMTFLRKF